MGVKIENNIAILSDGEEVRKIDLQRDYMSEVDNIIAELENKLNYFKDIKNKIYKDQKMILNYLIKEER